MTYYTQKYKLIVILLGLLWTFNVYADITEQGCNSVPCLKPSIAQSAALFAQIEQQYPQFFAPAVELQTQVINKDTAHFKLYKNLSAAGLATYQGGIWYAMAGEWHYFSTLDDANRLFCQSACWTSHGVFTLTSPVDVDGGSLPIEYTCDGKGSSIALNWTNVPSGTQEFALLMTTLPVDGSTKWNWILYNIPATLTSLSKDSLGIGTLGVGSDGPNAAYQPPCSKGPGAKVYTFTLYALSSSPHLSVPAKNVTGAILTQAISSITLGKASLSLSYSRTNVTSSVNNCLNIQNSTLASTTGKASVSCDNDYAYISSDGLATHPMMNGITATNLQVPIAQNFMGANAWKIPLNPALAAKTTTAIDGPIGVAINGVPIFNPCKQGGCQNGDTKVLGELDVCNGHAGRADDYHYHAAPVCLMTDKPAEYWDTHPVGWALDGFAIFGYHNADGTLAARDAVCGGNTSTVINGPAGYSYHLTDTSPYVLSCFMGTPSPDLVNQAAKYSPLRKPPVTPFAVSNMSLSTDQRDGYQVLQFSSARTFVSTETGVDSYSNLAGTYQIRYQAVSGSALASLLVQPQYKGKSSCWNFQFSTDSGKTTQPTVTYCR